MNWQDWNKPEPYRSKKDPIANNHLNSLEREIEGLKRQNAEQAEEIKSIAWMCKACQSTFPSMIVKQMIDGRLQCPRCDEGGTVVRAHEALPLIMKEKVARLQAFEEENKTLKETIKRLEARLVTLGEELNRYRLRFKPSEGRAVEGEP